MIDVLLHVGAVVGAVVVVGFVLLAVMAENDRDRRRREVERRFGRR